jgi:DEAD/DEAH box helicase domain-containing protein
MSWVAGLAAQAGYRIVACAELPARAPRLAPVPERLRPTLKEHLVQAWPEGLYGHQAAALEAFLDGRDVCLATSTASGKSLVFIAASTHLLLTDSRATVLALYPAKALIKDQIRKWRAQLDSFGISFGHIDGGVPTDARRDILRGSRVLLMTPDVTHAWLLSHLADPDIRRFLSSLRLLILDETHVYEGVFGTNMAYLLRRLQVASGLRQLICSTATLGKPADFLQQLTGREPVTFGADEDSSGTPRKEIVVLRCVGGNSFDAIVTLLVGLASGERGRFLAFADSRRMVEQVVAAVHRPARPKTDGEDDEPVEAEPGETHRVLPYRAGYEEQDRKQIQDALNDGQLAGVVATSALELGIDIGDLDLVVLLGPPPSVKAFRQRLGRVGRKRRATCLILDDKGLLADSTERLEAYLRREPEPSWLYLENRYLQYANALCTSVELAEGRAEGRDLSAFRSLPPSFGLFLENELNPKEAIADDLYVLKQRAQGGPHREFPIRSGVEKEFRVQTPDGQPLGTLTFSQALREAYPGAIYHYMARPYRVFRFDYRRGQVIVKWEKRWTTRPLSQTMVFPRFRGGALGLVRSDEAFLAEAEMQVSERVIGFAERRGGAAPQEYRYGPASPYYQRPLSRFFQTTGVCWYFPDKGLVNDTLARVILEAFCLRCSVQERDLGVGVFHAQESPLGPTPCQGICIYDAADGSLRLTQRLAEGFDRVVDAAISLLGKEAEEGAAVALLKQLLGEFRKLERVVPQAGPAPVSPAEGDWIVVISPGSKGVYVTEDGTVDVEVMAYRYTPQGLVYELVPQTPGTRWLVKASTVQPIHAETKMLRFNLVTGETQSIE